MPDSPIPGEATVAAPVLEMRGIRKVFPGVVALDDVDVDVVAGEVHALLGENGAGKSTLIKILAGVHRRDGGTMRVAGEEVDFASPADSLGRRIKVVYQELDLVDGLSVAENVFLGGYPKTPRGLVDFAAMRNRTRELLADLGLEIDPALPVGELRVAEQQMVEIARALSRQARLIVMDEPTSALSPAEVDTLFGVIARLKSRGVAIVYVSHKLDEIERIADRVTVFRDGRRVVTAGVAETTPRQLVAWMVGRELHDLFPKSAPAIGGPLLVVDRLSGSGLRDVSFAVNAGEIVGVYGLMGAGINTLGRALFGAAARDGGSVVLAGAAIRPNHPRDAIAKGMGLLTENRKQDGLVLPLAVRANMTLAALARFADLSWIKGGAETRAAAEYVDRLGIKTPSLRQPVRYLSGGNQQKVLMARWMLRQDSLKLLILAEPTRGIDVGSKAEIYRLIDAMAHRGIGIVFMSTEIPEILGIADRILVMREGRITAELGRAEATQERLVAAAATDDEPLPAALPIDAAS
ncbi:MAG: Ribose ABC transport system, ATP-binding protein RbsA [uncultured Thermomicrobiales bacterium]|uniref:Ribose ABC transport system, ATP-binding protein RbsA n=1 Tax=uncultured Thermomicrobiales bacterium TaxID=1645740 RepID=A0A6J4UFB2_9BACT|nr:MAG: Ribose ABC transport system, ATP-binding protein RbsA [uncultured Thermomicrobiales bacterium]